MNQNLVPEWWLCVAIALFIAAMLAVSMLLFVVNRLLNRIDWARELFSETLLLLMENPNPMHQANRNMFSHQIIRYLNAGR